MRAGLDRPTLNMAITRLVSEAVTQNAPWTLLNRVASSAPLISWRAWRSFRGNLKYDRPLIDDLMVRVNQIDAHRVLALR